MELPCRLRRTAVAAGIVVGLAAGAGQLPAQVLVPTQATWSYRKGAAEASAPIDAWRLGEFDDSEWDRGEAPFYYDTGNGYTGNTVLGDMRNAYTSVYLRRTFVVEDPGSLGALDLRYYCDDGFALWINGAHVAGSNKADGDYRHNTLATGSASEPLTWLGTTLGNPQDYLREGTNHLAVQAFNVSRTSSDFVFEMELVARPRDSEPPALVAIDPPPGTVGSLGAITVTFSEPVAGLGFSDLLVNDRPAVGMSGSGTTYTFIVDPPGYGEVRVRWDEGSAITDFADPPNRFDPSASGAKWSYALIDGTAPRVVQSSPSPGTTVRQLTQLEVLFSEPVTGVDAADLRVNDLAAVAVTGTGPGPYRFELPALGGGEVRVEWDPGHGIHDEAVPPNPLEATSWTYTVDPTYTPPSVRITEFLTGYTGEAGLRDEDDELQDWIELQNRSEAAVNLAGWSLTDDPDLPGKWVFPETSLAPGAYLVVFASGKDRRPVGAGTRLHTSFKLGSDGEYLALYNAELPRVKIVEWAPGYPPQRHDYSCGLDSQDRLRYFEPPTPGAPNGDSAIVGLVPEVAVNVRRGIFSHPFELHLSCALEGADIRYTTDGSEPSTVNGRVYNGPFTVSTTTILRATAFRPNHLPSIPVTHSYLFPAQAARQSASPQGLPAEWIDTQGRRWTADYGMDPEIVDDPAYRDQVVDSLLSLPIVSLVTKPEDMFDNSTGIYPKSQARGPSWERPGSVEFIDAAGSGSAQVNCGIQMQGNSVRDPVKTAKHAFRLVFKGDYGPAKFRYRVFPDSPVEEFDTITLRADFNNSWMHWNGAQRPRGQRVRDAWMKDSHRAMGGLSSHSRFYHLYVNGLYWGVYDATERPDASFAASYFGGSKEDFDVINEGQLVDGSMAAYNAMRGIGNLADNAQYERLKQSLDVPAYIDYVLLHFYTGHEDWFTDKNWYAIRRRAVGEGFRYQCWDGELMLNSPTQNIVTRNDQPTDLHPKLRENAQYRLDFADRVHRHLFHGGALTPDVVATRYDRWAGHVASAMIAESARWGDYRRDVHQYSSGPYLLYTPNDHFATERARLKDAYFPGRTATLLGQLKAAGLYPVAAVAPVFTPARGPLEPGATLTLSAPSGTIYFTTDGSDPRIHYAGDPALNAEVYHRPVTLSQTTWIKARTWLGGEWSALNEARFEVGRLGVPLAITEVHYHPREGDPYEFVEIRNLGTTEVDASGFALEGVRFVFPPGSLIGPGQVWVIASGLSPSSFARHYPGVTVFGYFEGTLDNGGERLALVDRNGATVESVDYNDAAGWPEAADGEGPSLERIEALGDPDAPATWRASAGLDGTPGVPAGPAELPVVRLNEVMAANTGSVTNGAATPDWLELFNSGSSPVDLAGWSLRSSGETAGFRFPAGTVLPPGGYLVVWCGGEGGGLGFQAGFALDRDGETVWLVDDAGVGVDALTFGRQLPDLTVCRLGAAGGWSLGVPTPGAANQAHSLADAARLTLNEWLANPPPGSGDWLELYNRDPDLPVSLEGITVSTATATFQLRALSFLGAGGYAVLKADQQSGPDHLDFKLPAAGDRLALRDAVGRVIDEVDYGPQVEGVAEGRLPDGAKTWVAFPESASPGAANYLPAEGGPVLNEVVAWNVSTLSIAAGPAPGWVEIRHPGAAAFDLSGMSLTTDPAVPRPWVFPEDTRLEPGAFLLLTFDPSAPPSVTAGTVMNTALSLDRRSGVIQFLDQAGRLVDQVRYGFQIPDGAIGRTSGGWRLLDLATPGEANGDAAELGAAASLRLNEWLAMPQTGPDWIEIHNPADRPVALTGLSLTDDPSLAGAGRFAFGPLSFIAGRGFVRIDATGRVGEGDAEATFQLDGGGEALVLHDAAGRGVDQVYFGQQAIGRSQGRSPDGAEGAFKTFDSPTPGAGNDTVANRPPVLAGIPDQSVAAGSTLAVTVTAADPDAPPQVLAFRLEAAPAGAVLDSTSGRLTWRPSLADVPGPHRFAVAVADDGVPPLEVRGEFFVTVLAPTLPRLEVIALTASSVRLLVDGDVGPDYFLEGSTDLRHWTALAQSTPSSLPVEWTVPLEGTATHQFLRVRLGASE